MNYEINDPWDWVTHFENELANYCGYKYAVACDSNSNAIRLVLHYLGIVNQDIEIPARTYVSVPNQIILSGNYPKFVDYEWAGMYELGNTGIIDAATALDRNMGKEYQDKYMILSFHLKKILNIGQGGMILTNDEKFNEWARPMIYDGRHKDTMYDKDEFECVGWHMYMAPESAKRGLEIFNSDRVQDYNEPVGSSFKYKDLRTQAVYRKYFQRPVFHYGCSFTQNIQDFRLGRYFEELGYQYVNYGLESSSNFRIYDTFEKTSIPNALCIIQWSSLTRPADENFSILQNSENPLYDLLEQWYEILGKTQVIAKERNIKLIQYIGWAGWKDSELNEYHRTKLNSYGIKWFESKSTLDMIQCNCFQIEAPQNWSSKEYPNGLYKWPDMKWGGMSEWGRENLEMKDRYVGYNNPSMNFLDPHPSEKCTTEFINNVLIPEIQKYE